MSSEKTPAETHVRTAAFVTVTQAVMWDGREFFGSGTYRQWHSVGPAALIAAQGLVVMSVNYRVGAEGFAQLDGAPANRGLLAEQLGTEATAAA